MRKTYLWILRIVLISAMIALLYFPLHLKQESVTVSKPAATALAVVQMNQMVATQALPQPPKQDETPAPEEKPVIEKQEEIPEKQEEPIEQIETKQETAKSETPENSENIQKDDTKQVEQKATVTDTPALINGYYPIVEADTKPLFDTKLLVPRIKYPTLARRQGKEGLVMLRLFISKEGIVEEISIEDDPGFGLADAALQALNGFKVQPATKDGKNIPVTMLYPVRFALH